MAKPTRISGPGTYFTTTQTKDRHPIFRKEEHAQLILETLQHYRHEGHYKLHAFVVMPDHIHLLLTPTEKIERAMMLLKGGFSHRLGYPIWQRSFTDHRIRERADFLAHRDYIHQNPVRARLCQTPKEYPYSSAYIQATKAGE